MRHMVIGASIFLDPHFRVMIDEAEAAFQDGDEVIYVSSTGACRTCIANPHAGRMQCAACKLLCKWFERRFRNRIRIVPLPVVTDSIRHFEYDSVAKLKSIVHEGVNIGYAAFSEYVTLTRDLLECITPEKRQYVDFLLAEACRYADMAKTLYETHSPDKVSVFNGRLLETRPFFELARLRKVPVRVNEVVAANLSPDEIEFRHFTFENCLPQDVDGYADKVRECWERSGISEEERNQVAREFFYRRRMGMAAGDAITPGTDGVFVQKQVMGELPREFDPSKRNIVIFNSSEDELSSIDREFESHALFLSHTEGIETVARILKNHPDYHLYLRVHPNLMQIKHPYHLRLYCLSEKHPNLTVLAADSSYSSYALMDAADKVVVLGSTAGVEATYCGRPVILIGSALYCKLDIAYKPRNVEELEELLLDANLAPRPKQDAIKYGYFLKKRTEISLKSRLIDMRVVRRKAYGEYRWIPVWPVIPGLNFLQYSWVSNCLRNALKCLARNVMPSRS